MALSNPGDSGLAPLRAAPPDVAARAVWELVRHGFANVAAVFADQCLFVTFESRRYRDERRTLTFAAELLRPALEAGQELALVPTARGIPLVVQRYAPISEPAPAPTATASPPEDLTVSLDVSRLPTSLLQAPPASQSLGRVEVVVHPWFEARFGDYDNPVASRTGIAPEARITLRPGLSLSVQALVTIQDDVPTGESRIRPALVTLNHTVRLPQNVFVSSTAGAFTPNRYGLDVEARTYQRGGRWSAGAELGRTGTVTYLRDGWHHGPLDSPTALADVSWWIPGRDVGLRVTAGTFLGGERGMRLDTWRRFGEMDLGGFVLRGGGGTNGGVTLRIPLVPGVRAAPGRVRFRAADAFPWQYRYNASVASGRGYHTGNSLDELSRLLQPGSHGEGTRSRAAASASPAIAVARQVVGPALTGTTGLVTVPTADLPTDGTVTMGINLIDSRHNGYVSRPAFLEHPAVVHFASVGFLPFMELGLRLTRSVGVPRQALGDRTVSVRLRLLEERRHTPAVVAGVQDVVGTRVFHAEYLAVSKAFAPIPLLGNVGLHLGHGGDWLSLRAKGRQFMGTFGGVSVAPLPWAAVLVEHDSRNINAAVRLRLRRFILSGAAMGLDGLSGGISYTVRP